MTQNTTTVDEQIAVLLAQVETLRVAAQVEAERQVKLADVDARIGALQSKLDRATKLFEARRDAMATLVSERTALVPAAPEVIAEEPAGEAPAPTKANKAMAFFLAFNKVYRAKITVTQKELTTLCKSAEVDQADRSSAQLARAYNALVARRAA